MPAEQQKSSKYDLTRIHDQVAQRHWSTDLFQKSAVCVDQPRIEEFTLLENIQEESPHVWLR